MKEEGRKRPPRIPLTPEEVAELITIKKIRQHNKLLKLKKSLTYKSLNCFNVFCFFVYCEIIISFYGPCHYQLHYSKNISISHNRNMDSQGRQEVENINITDVNEHNYVLVVNEFIDEPSKYTVFNVGKDYLLQSEIKAYINTSDNYYRINRVSPILFLSVFLGIFSIIFFSFNLNQNINSLSAISVINAIAILAFVLNGHYNTN